MKGEDDYCVVCQEGHKMSNSCFQCKNCSQKGHLRIDCPQDSSRNEELEEKSTLVPNLVIGPPLIQKFQNSDLVSRGIKRKSDTDFDYDDAGSKVSPDALSKSSSQNDFKLSQKLNVLNSLKVEYKQESDCIKQEVCTGNHQDNNNILSNQESKPELKKEIDDMVVKQESAGERITTKVSGTVKWFNVKSGYGFITRNDTKDDVFVHHTAIISKNAMKKFPTLGDGELVEFDVIIDKKGMSLASNVSGPKGAAVKGSLYARDRRGCGGKERGGKGRSTNGNESGRGRGRGRRQLRKYTSRT